MRHGTANGGVQAPARPADPSVRDCKRGCCWSPYGHSTVRDMLPQWHTNACHCHDTTKGNR